MSPDATHLKSSNNLTLPVSLDPKKDNRIFSELESSSIRIADANRGRDYSIYSRAMDAAEDEKAKDIFPHIHVHEGATILDLGAGTAALAERAARYFSRSRVIAQDLSHELLEIADHRRALINLVYANALDRVFPSNSLDAAICSSCGHEIESFGGAGSILKALSVVLDELRPGAPFVLRDFVKPDLEGDVLLDILDSDIRSAAEISFNDAKPDYSKLTTAQLFIRFHREFNGGNAFEYALEERGGRTVIRLAAEWAYEFYMRKDYVANWHNEIKEKYSYWTPNDALLSMRAVGFEDVKVIPKHNQWLEDNRLKGKVALFRADLPGLVSVPFFPTHMVVVGNKPKASDSGTDAKDIKIADYDQILSEIKVTDQNVQIGELRFELAQRPGILGSKREVFYLAPDLNGQLRVLKIPRTDGINSHNCFKAMYQTVARESVLDECRVPHAKILDFDRSGPPYRWLIQEALPDNSESAAQLILQGRLTEEDILQMARIINRFETDKRWQLDTNPFNWYRVTARNGKTQMTYGDGKVYLYDEKWSFSRVGLLQWIDPKYVHTAQRDCADVPKLAEVQKQNWWDLNNPVCAWWAKYLDPHLLPNAKQ